MKTIEVIYLAVVFAIITVILFAVPWVVFKIVSWFTNGDKTAWLAAVGAQLFVISMWLFEIMDRHDARR